MDSDITIPSLRAKSTFRPVVGWPWIRNASRSSSVLIKDAVSWQTRLISPMSYS